jgi:hypothetical protein
MHAAFWYYSLSEAIVASYLMSIFSIPILVQSVLQLGFLNRTLPTLDIVKGCLSIDYKGIIILHSSSVCPTSMDSLLQ